MDYILHTHQQSSIKTIIDFVSDTNSIAFGIDVDTLLKYKWEDGDSNLDKIWEELINKQLQTTELFNQYNNGGGDFFPLPVDTVLAIPNDLYNREIVITESNQEVVEETFSEFYINKLEELQKDIKYTPITKSVLNNLGITKNIFPQMTVWIWCRHLDTVINVTPFIQSVNTYVDDNGGNFSFTFPPISCKFEGGINGKWEIDPDAIKLNSDGSFDSVNSNIHKAGTDFKRNNFFFNRVLRENDLVLIRFETLQTEIKERVKYRKMWEIPTDALPGNIYDMIGLIDKNSIITDGETSDVSINIQGRDLVKMLIEDGCYFFSSEFTPGGIFTNNSNNENGLERIDGKLHLLSQQVEKTINFSLKFILNNLSNISICPTEVFSNYEDKTFKYKLDIDSKKEKLDLNNKKDELFKIINDNISESRKIEGLRKESINDETPILVDTYGKLLKFCEFLIENDKVITKIPFLYNFTGLDYNGYESKLSNEIPIDLQGFLITKDSVKKLKNASDKEKVKDLNENIQGRGAVIDLYKDELKTLPEKVVSKIKTVERLVKQSDGTEILETVTVDNPISQDQAYEEWLLDTKFKDYNVGSLEELVDAGALTDPFEFESEFKNSSFSNGNLVDNPEIEIKNSKIRELETEKAGLESKRNGLYVNNLVLKYKDKVNVQAQFAFDNMYKYLALIKSISEHKYQYEETPMKGVWQIVKLVIDENVEDLRLLDNSIGDEYGSILNAINNVCQKPFVEFFSDTYGDQFYYIARRQPYNKAGFEALRKYATDIEEEDVLMDTLDNYNGDVYSWYRIVPQSLMEGGDKQMIWAYIKAIRFKEYADIFGDKPFDQITPYISFFPILKEDQKISVDYLANKVLNELKYLIESNAYLPFTRQGTIKINPDRRIKRGTMVRLKSTGEIFHVDSVTNSFMINESSIDRYTSLTVSRGIVEQYFDFYFNIINLKLEKQTSYNSEDGYVKYLDANMENWKVNSPENNGGFNAFEFLLNNLQFR